MNKLDGREKIIAILGAIPDRYQGVITESDKATLKKVDKIGKILNKNPALFQDETVARKVIQFTEPKKEDARIRQFREEFIFNACCHVEEGVIHITRNNLVSNDELYAAIISCGGGLASFPATEGLLRISEHDLKNFENFWDFIQEKEVKTLEITTEDNKNISYTEATLDQLLDKKPPVGDLTEIYTIKFGLGESTTLPKAKLTLCGGFFEWLARSSMQESVSKVIKLKKGITKQGFFEILDQVETGKAPRKLSKAYLQAADFLQFVSPQLPEGFYGSEALAKYGFKDIPPPPRECIHFWNANCKPTTHMAVYVPPTSLDEMNERAQKTDAKHKTKLWISPSPNVQKLRSQKVEKGYWLILETDVKGLNGNEEAHRATCPDSYELPLTLDVVMCNLLLYVNTGKCLFGRNPYRYVRCHEKVSGTWNVVVGGFAPTELCVNYYAVYDDLGVVRARKFR